MKGILILLMVLPLASCKITTKIVLATDKYKSSPDSTLIKEGLSIKYQSYIFRKSLYKRSAVKNALKSIEGLNKQALALLKAETITVATYDKFANEAKSGVQHSMYMMKMENDNPTGRDAILQYLETIERSLNQILSPLKQNDHE
jgi:hypothetical protein